MFPYTREVAHVESVRVSFISLNIMSFKNFILNGWSEAFWDPSFWLPKNMTWEDFKDTPDVTYPKYYEVGYPIIFSVFIFLLRYLVERSVS